MTGKKKTGILITAVGIVAGVRGVGLLDFKRGIVSNKI